MLKYSLLHTVLSPMLAVAGDAGLVRLELLPLAYQYHTHAHAVAKSLGETETPQEDSAPFIPLREQLAEYFTGVRTDFDLPLDLRGSEFQLTVWQQIRHIPFGKLRTYKQIARMLHKPTAGRAVGQATGQNPLPLLIPCHRVVGSDGGLVGFAGGLSVKAQLLRLEGHTLGDSPRLQAPELF